MFHVHTNVSDEYTGSTYHFCFMLIMCTKVTQRLSTLWQRWNVKMGWLYEWVNSNNSNWETYNLTQSQCAGTSS